jgi:hypothetical protein
LQDLEDQSWCGCNASSDWNAVQTRSKRSNTTEDALPLKKNRFIISEEETTILDEEVPNISDRSTNLNLYVPAPLCDFLDVLGVDIIEFINLSEEKLEILKKTLVERNFYKKMTVSLKKRQDAAAALYDSGQTLPSKKQKATARKVKERSMLSPQGTCYMFFTCFSKIANK